MSWMNADAQAAADRQRLPHREEVTCQDCGQIAVYDVYGLHQEPDDKLGGFGGRTADRKLISGGCDCAARRAAAEAARLAAEAEAHRQRHADDAAEGGRYWLLPVASPEAVLEYDLGLDAEITVGQWLAESRRRNAAAVNIGAESPAEYRVVVDGDSLVAICRDASGARILCRRKFAGTTEDPRGNL